MRKLEQLMSVSERDMTVFSMTCADMLKDMPNMNPEGFRRDSGCVCWKTHTVYSLEVDFKVRTVK